MKPYFFQSFDAVFPLFFPTGTQLNNSPMEADGEITPDTQAVAGYVVSAVKGWEESRASLIIQIHQTA